MKNILITLCSFTFASSLVLADTMGADNDTSAATDTAPRYEVSFEQLDADGDGVISEQEAAAGGITGEGFERLDKDGNGELSREELLGVSGNQDQAPGTYNPGNSSGRDVDRGMEHRSNEMSPTERPTQ